MACTETTDREKVIKKAMKMDIRTLPYVRIAGDWSTTQTK
jgi:hypothetical protein